MALSPSHFEIDSLSSLETDWRVHYQIREDERLTNEWLASLYVKINLDDLLTQDTYGTRYPLARLYMSHLRNIAGVKDAILFMVYKHR